MDSEEKETKKSNASVEANAQKIIGYYKRQAWALKVFDKIEQDSIVEDGKNVILASSVIQSNNDLFFPAFIRINTKENGKVVGAYLIIEEEENFQLLPLERALEEFELDELVPFKYRTLEKIDGDQFQVNWPEFS
ncbi:hypothetical protein [Psychrobacillus antarcticus]|uniref:hypothetical protein n=1 Tax=Psychrobacillus antarcticus TaxID=2879115 RepID=UPI00240808A8|nr:hypothetical protein [Psychrobacillus antarcticus]